jgi:hypothetical protein
MANEVTVKATALLLAAAFLIALLAVGSTPVTTLPDFYRNLWATTHPGDRVSVALQRGTERFTVEIEAMDRYQRYAAGRRKP